MVNVRGNLAMNMARNKNRIGTTGGSYISTQPRNSFAPATFGDILQNSIKSNIQNPFTNETILNFNDPKDFNAQSDIIIKKAMLGELGGRGKTPTPLDRRLLPSLKQHPNATILLGLNKGLGSTHGNEAMSSTATSVFTSKANKSNNKRAKSIHRPQNSRDGSRLEPLTLMPETCSVKIQQREAANQKMIIVKRAQDGLRQISINNMGDGSDMISEEPTFIPLNKEDLS